MSDVAALLAQCRGLGAIFIPMGDRLRVRAPDPLPENLIVALREVKPQVLVELNRQGREDFHCWVLEEWRRCSIPSWRRILRESIAQGDSKREEYALWMLREVLIDPEYKESGHEHIG